MNPAALLGAFKPVPYIDPLEIQQQQSAVKQGRAQASIAQDQAAMSKQDMADDQAVRGILGESGGKFDENTLAKLGSAGRAGRATATAMVKSAHEIQTAKYQATKAQLDAEKEQIAIENADMNQVANQVGTIDSEETRKLVVDGIKNKELRAKLAGLSYGTPEYNDFVKVVTGQVVDAKTKAEMRQKEVDAKYRASEEEFRAWERQQKKLLAPLELSKATNEAQDTVRDANGLTAKDRATVATRAPEAEPASVKEFKYAQTQGYKGTYQQYQNEDANRRRPVTNVSVNSAPTVGADGTMQANPTVKGIAEYKINPAAMLSRGSMADKKAMMDAVLAINPDYDATNFPARNKTAMDYAPGGKEGQAIKAADTALAHIATIEDLSKAMKNGDVQKLNQLFNYLGTQTGQSAPNNFRTAVRMVAPEIAKAVVGGQTSQQDRKDMEEGFSSSASDAQVLGAARTAARLLAERVQKSKHAYKSQMGRDLSLNLSPESQAVLQRFESGNGGGGQSSGPKKGDKRTYRGHEYTFDGKQWMP